MNKEKIEKHYAEVKDFITEALQTSFADNYNNEEENAFAENIRQQLSELNDSFKSEIEELEQISEWDKFCISFFGETNAGKSTIIESLRIIYNEECRLKKIIENQGNMNDCLLKNNEAYKSLIEHTESLKQLVKNQKKSVSIRTLIISIITTIIIVSTLFISGTFDFIRQLIG